MSAPVTTYKFLASGAVGPISRFVWPVASDVTPGDWVEVSGSLSACSRGIHVCRPAELAHWLHDELWEVEVGGDSLEAPDCLVVRRARLLRRIEAWSAAGAIRCAEACLDHARELAGDASDATVRGYLDDAQNALSAGYPAVSTFCAALAAGALDPSNEQSFRRERAWQASWIAREIIGT